MPTPVEDRYIDLMKDALSFSLWEETGPPIDQVIPPAWYDRVIMRGLARVLNIWNLKAFYGRTAAASENGVEWPGQADTMIGRKRLDNLQFCVEDALRRDVPGDLIETGVWRGGACIFMRAILAAHGDTTRKVYVADSFQGLPEPDVETYAADRGDEHHKWDFLAVSEAEVRRNFERYGLLDDQVVFLKGWFKDTLPAAPAEQYAVIRLDGDMYESTMDALRSLYPRLSPGGYCIIDDYGLPRCALAVDDYRREHAITAPLEQVDWSGVYWQKS